MESPWVVLHTCWAKPPSYINLWASVSTVVVWRGQAGLEEVVVLLAKQDRNKEGDSNKRDMSLYVPCYKARSAACAKCFWNIIEKGDWNRIGVLCPFACLWSYDNSHHLAGDLARPKSWPIAAATDALLLAYLTCSWKADPDLTGDSWHYITCR